MNNNNDYNRSQNLNLKNIILWTLVPKETLKWLAACCESLHSLKGTSVLSQIYSFVHYGGCNNCLNNILNEVSKPFILFVINWIKYGELQDTNKEFFVDILNGINDDDIWNLQYQLIGKNVPNFMKREPTLKIFEVGKCIHFIRNYCQENYNLSNLKNILINLIKKYSVIKGKKGKEKLELNIMNNLNQNPDNQMDFDESSEPNNRNAIKDQDFGNKNNLKNEYSDLILNSVLSLYNDHILLINDSERIKDIEPDKQIDFLIDILLLNENKKVKDKIENLIQLLLY